MSGSTNAVPANPAPFRAQLSQTLNLPQAVGLAITILVGSGLLTLPGLAYNEAGSAAIYAWVISAAVSAPLLVIFATLGGRIPNAGGIAGFIQAAFTRNLAVAAEFVLLGIFMTGGAAVAITGGNYLAAFFNEGKVISLLGSLLLLLMVGAINYRGARLSARVQQTIAVILVILLTGIAMAVLLFNPQPRGTGIAPITDWSLGIPSVGLVFFAFVGWEMMSFVSEEFKNPKRDFPLMIAFSFLIVTALYLLIAAAVQYALAPDEATTAPIAALLATVTGDVGGRIIGLLGLIIVFGNFSSGVWAASRLVFSSAREGLLPVAISALHQPSGTPRRAVIVTMLAFLPAVALYYADFISHGDLFRLAGVGFFSLYAMSVLAYLKLTDNTLAHVFGLATLALVLAVLWTFGIILIFPLVLFSVGWLWQRRASSRH